MSYSNITETTYKPLRDYIVVASNILSHDVCRRAMSLFDNMISNHEHHATDGYNFSQLNVTRHSSINQECKIMHDELVHASLNALKFYKQRVSESSFWPDRTALEEFRIKRYLPNSNHRFDDHVDAAGLSTSKRYLAFFWYLNDVTEGGETCFPSLDISVKPQAGRALIFPPMWMFPHRANTPISGPKYMVGSYLHFT